MQRRHRSTVRATDRGQAAILMVAVLAMVGTLAIAVVTAGRELWLRQRAGVAADASALAGTTGGRPAAERLAALNGGALVSFVEDGDDVTVVVDVGGRRAMARASDGP
jgi:cytochrome c biogenesis protein ResB